MNEPIAEYDFFQDHGGYLSKVDLEPTADSHSRRIIVDGQYFGMLLFHKWDFQVDVATYGGPPPIFRLKIIPQIMKAINRDTSIAYQKREDERANMAFNARRGLTEAGVDHSAMNDRQAVEAYLGQQDIAK